MEALEEAFAGEEAEPQLAELAWALGELEATVGTLTVDPLEAAGVLHGLLNVPGADGGRGFSAPFATTDYLRDLSRDTAFYLYESVREGDGSAARTVWRGLVRHNFEFAVSRMESAEEVYQLETEATVRQLFRARRRFQLAEDPLARAEIGDEIGVLSRRALLLDAESRRLREEAAPLQRAVEGVAPAVQDIAREVAGPLAQIGRSQFEEESTLADLGDAPELLGVRRVGVPSGVENPSTGHFLDEVGVEPEEAFPLATDAAVEAMIERVADEATDHAEAVRSLHDRVVPREPTYDFEEFLGVYRRWLAFFSPAARDADPQFQTLSTLYSELHAVLGFAGFEGGLARSVLARIVSDHLPLHPASTDFAREIAPASRSDEVEGRASSPELSPEVGFGDRQSRRGYRQSRERHAGSAFGRLHRSLSAPLQPGDTAVVPFSSAQAVGLDRRGDEEGPVVLHGSALDTWTYLLSTPPSDFETDPAKQVGIHEQREVPPEVSEYLLAVRQLRTAVAPLTPQANGTSIGDLPTRLAGIEEARGTAADRYLGGDLGAENLDVERDRERIGAARAALPSGTGDLRPLLREMERYLHDYFAENPSFVAVLHVAVGEYGGREQFMAAFTPRNLAVMGAFIIGVVGTLGTLSLFGPVGRAVSAGLGQFLKRVGIRQDVSFATTLAAWLLRADQITSFREARGWAFFARDLLADIANFVLGLGVAGTMSAVQAVGAIRGVARTRNGLLDAFDPILRDPEIRAQVSDDLDRSVRRLRRSEPDSPRLEELTDFRRALSERYGDAAPVATHPDRPIQTAGGEARAVSSAEPVRPPENVGYEGHMRQLADLPAQLAARPPRIQFPPGHEFSPQSLDDALGSYRQFTTEFPDREVAVFRSLETGTYQVRLGDETVVSAPGRNWAAVVHTHPNVGDVALLRMPAPTDVLLASVAHGRTGRPHVEYIDYSVGGTGGGRGMTRYEVGDGGAVTVRYTGPDGPVVRQFDGFEAYERYYMSHTVAAPRGSPLYNRLVRDLERRAELVRDSDAAPVGTHTATGGTGAVASTRLSVRTLDEVAAARATLAAPPTSAGSAAYRADWDDYVFYAHRRLDAIEAALNAGTTPKDPPRTFAAFRTLYPPGHIVRNNIRGSRFEQRAAAVFEDALRAGNRAALDGPVQHQRGCFARERPR